HGVGEVCYRRVAGRIRVYTAGEPRRYLLEQPGIAVRVAKDGERSVAGALRLDPGDASVGSRGFELTAGSARMEDLTDFRAAPNEFGTGGPDVGHDEVQALGGAGRGRRDFCTELNRRG